MQGSSPCRKQKRKNMEKNGLSVIRMICDKKHEKEYPVCSDEHGIYIPMVYSQPCNCNDEKYIRAFYYQLIPWEVFEGYIDVRKDRNGNEP